MALCDPQCLVTAIVVIYNSVRNIGEDGETTKPTDGVFRCACTRPRGTPTCLASSRAHPVG